MKLKFFVCLLLVCGLLLPGCKFVGGGVRGSGNRKTEKRNPGSFKTIDAIGACEIDVTCQKPASFEIEADDNILPLIKTEVRDGVLHVSEEQGYSSSQAVVLRISLPELSQITSQGAGVIKVANATGDTIKFDSTGAAAINANGKVNFVIISSTGAGEIDTSKLQAQKAQVSTAGAASIEVYASEQLDVDLSGAGSVSYWGNPKTVNKHVSGFGSVTKKEE